MTDDDSRVALRRSHGRLLEAADASAVGVLIHSYGRVIEGNKAAARILHAPEPEALRGHDVLEFVPPAQRLGAQQRLAAIRQGVPSDTQPRSVLAFDGQTLVPVSEVASMPLLLDGEELALTMFVDASERALRAEQFEHSRLEGRAGAFSLELGSGRVHISTELQQLMGLPTDPRAVHEAFLARVHAEDREAVISALEGLPRTRQPMTHQYRVLLPDGRVVQVETHAQAFDENDDGVFEIIRGTTREVGAAEPLPEAELRFRALFEGSPDALLVVDDGGLVVMANRVAERLLAAGGALVGRRVEDFMPAEVAGRHAAHRATYQHHPGVRPMGVGATLSAQTADGTLVPVEIRLGPATMDGRRVVIASLRDVSERVRATQLELERREKAMRRQGALVSLTREASGGELAPEAIAMVAARELGLQAAILLTFDPPGLRGPELAPISLEPADERFRYALGSGEFSSPNVLGDQRLPESWRFALAKAGGAELLAKPLFDGQALTGALCFLGSGATSLGQEDLGFATAVSALVSLRLELARRQGAEAVAAQRLVEVEAARAAAVKADAAKSEFLASMSHEIRTPLHAALGYCQLLGASRLTREQMELLDVVTTSGKTLLALVDDLLDFSRLEAGRIDLDALPFALRDVCHEVGALLDQQARQKGLSLSVNVAGHVPEWVRGDARRIKQVLFNLVGNAVKFTEVGAVTVDVELSQPPLVGFRVSDTGVGLERADLERIFLRFEQVSRGASRRHDGAGLGLSIAKALVEAMGGRIGATSQPGLGSSFWFAVPLPLAAEVPVPLAEVASIDCSGAQVLVADDNVVNRQLLKRLLEPFGCVVETAADGAEALRACSQRTFDLVLMDCHMPEVDGFEATAELRRRERDDQRVRVPVVAVTASVLREDRRRGEAVGMDAFLTKPLKPKDLRDLLTLFIAMPRRKA